MKLVRLEFIQPDGVLRSVEAHEGESLMHAGVRHNVVGIEAECGGCCACATCHVYVADEWRDRVPAASEIEDDMLNAVAAERLAGSRLACQINATLDLEGLRVRVAEHQT